MFSQFARDVNDQTDTEDWQLWMRSDLKIVTAILIGAAQEQVLRINYVKCRKDNTIDSHKCRTCGDRDETIRYIVSEFPKLAQGE